MTVAIKTSGTWKYATAALYDKIYIRNGNAWTTARFVKIRYNGAWVDSGYYGVPDKVRNLAPLEVDTSVNRGFASVVWEPPYIGYSALVTPASENAGMGTYSETGGPGGIRYYHVKVVNGNSPFQTVKDVYITTRPGDSYTTIPLLAYKWFCYVYSLHPGDYVIFEVSAVGTPYNHESVLSRLGIQMGYPPNPNGYVYFS